MGWFQYVIPTVGALIGGLAVAALTYRFSRLPALESELHEQRLANVACQEKVIKLQLRVSTLEKRLRAVLGKV